MNSRERVVKFLNRNVVLITTLAIVVSTHWGWSKLQQNPGLVPQENRTELPVVLAAKALKRRIVDTFTGPQPVPEVTEKTP